MPHPLLQSVIDAIRTIKDPEIPVNIYDLGLIYDIVVEDAEATRNSELGTRNFSVTITMTLTSPNCPVAEALPNSVRAKVRELPGVADATVNLVFDPPWTPEKMSEDAKLALDFIPGASRASGGFEAMKRKSQITPITVRRRPD